MSQPNFREIDLRSQSDISASLFRMNLSPDHRNAAREVLEGNPDRSWEEVYELNTDQIQVHAISNYDGGISLRNFGTRVVSVVSNAVNELGPIKVLIRLSAIMSKGSHHITLRFDSDIFTVSPFRSMDEIMADIEEEFEKLLAQIENKQTQGSGFTLERIQWLRTIAAKYNSIRAGGFIPTPAWLRSRGVVNIQNSDDRCVLYCLAASFHPCETDKPQRAKQYEKHFAEFNTGDLQFPLKVDNLDKLSALNAWRFQFKVYATTAAKQIVPVRKFVPRTLSASAGDCAPGRVTPSASQPRRQAARLIRLLIINDDTGKNHFALIKDFSRLVSSQINDHEHANAFCDYCDAAYRTEEALKKHRENFPTCWERPTTVANLPTEEKKWLQFKKFNHQLPVPFSNYCDFECRLINIDEKRGERTTLTQRHQLLSFAVMSVAHDSIKGTTLWHEPRLVFYSGPDAGARFVKECLNIAEKQRKAMSTNVSMVISEQEERQFQAATACHICKGPFKDSQMRHRDHDHFTGAFRGAAHEWCNVNHNYKNTALPFYFHNGKGYDFHFVLRELLAKKIQVSAISNNEEKQLAITANTTGTGMLRFMDSLAHLQTSIENLAKVIPADRRPALTHAFGEKAGIMCQKGVFPYEWFDDEAFEKLTASQLPPIESFTSSLSGPIDDADYEFAKSVWTDMGCETMRDYLRIYNVQDVAILADAFENYRRIALDENGLDPAYYITAPSLAMDAMLFSSRVRLELITDPQIYRIFESGIRGGITNVPKKYSKASAFGALTESTNEKKAIKYYDANNLYGHAMTRPLPVSDFKLVEDLTGPTTPETIASIMALNENDSTGHVFMVDAHDPAENHERHIDYPLMAERIAVPREWLSEHQKKLSETKSIAGESKLLLTFTPKKNHVVSLAYLKLAIREGMVVSHIHHHVTFTQSTFIREYIERNTELRNKAKTEIKEAKAAGKEFAHLEAKSDYYKLMNNAVFGKTMEDVRKRRDIEFIAKDDKRLVKWASSPFYAGCDHIGDGILVVNFAKESVTLDKPIAVGFTILEHSKELMARHFYGIVDAVGRENVCLLMTDTDSFVLEIAADKVGLLAPFINDTELGKLKDEYPRDTIKEFIGIRPKQYSILTESGAEIKKAKGVPRNYLKQNMTHEDYRRAIMSDGPHAQEGIFFTLRSRGQQMFTEQHTKTTLKLGDDKVYLLDNINSVPYGYNSNCQGQ